MFNSAWGSEDGLRLFGGQVLRRRPFIQTREMVLGCWPAKLNLHFLGIKGSFVSFLSGFPFCGWDGKDVLVGHTLF